MNKQEYIEAEYGEINDIIRRTFDKPDFDCLDQGWGATETHVVIVDLSFYDEFWQRYVNNFIEKNEDCPLVYILCELAKRGVIEPGKYIISTY